MNGDRKKLLQEFDPATMSSKGYCLAKGIKWTTWRRWLKNKDTILKAKVNKKGKTLGGQGRRETIPFAKDLHEFMNSVRDGEHHLTHTHLITYMKSNHMEWLTDYLASKKSEDRAYHSLLRLCQRFSARYRFSQRVPCASKLKQVELLETKKKFAAEFWAKFADKDPSDIINVDETAVYYDMPPGKTLAKIGGSSKVTKAQKHSYRMTAVLSIRSNGDKLPILFIIKGKPGGPIDQDELLKYPPGHLYVVQENAWMDSEVWEIYLNDLLKFEIGGPSVILADNLDCHVSQESHDMISSDLFSVLEPLPKNSTSVCQPLDVGVMGPLKSKLRSLWLREKPVVSAAEKMFAMIERTIAAWDAMPCNVASRAFAKAIPNAATM
ncbi:Aste57867_2874 [Aphanomyces stellatus]|uniref:Aste57867_2874 protein n=1 Tax=Aphanomyces stellatus TaxID=120398 RepID=A0A485KDQ5_9STRA|nr:hypothetical protein As57867_002866 [Aphanomyces stellatus]VFT80060.1 Aste57867_2874 [Aphanomyces stellatus]